jgi:hypothetical protein
MMATASIIAAKIPYAPAISLDRGKHDAMAMTITKTQKPSTTPTAGQYGLCDFFNLIFMFQLQQSYLDEFEGAARIPAEKLVPLADHSDFCDLLARLNYRKQIIKNKMTNANAKMAKTS